MRGIFEYVVATVIGSIVVIVAIIGYLNFFVFTDKNPTNITPVEVTPQVLGSVSESKESYKLLSDSFTNEYTIDTAEVSIIELTNSVSSESYLLFDNLNLDSIEGTTVPNSFVILKFGQNKVSSLSDDEGLFKIKLPKNLIPFTKTTFLTLDSNEEELNRKEFILVLQQYLNRSYFLVDSKDMVFSLSTGDLYTTLPNKVNNISNEKCYGEFQPYSTGNASSESSMSETLVFPEDESEYDFNLKPFVAFKVTNLTDFYSLDYCKTEWNKIGSTLKWHSEN